MLEILVAGGTGDRMANQNNIPRVGVLPGQVAEDKKAVT